VFTSVEKRQPNAAPLTESSRAPTPVTAYEAHVVARGSGSSRLPQGA
jgi:hypothetical protein